MKEDAMFRLVMIVLITLSTLLLCGFNGQPDGARFSGTGENMMPPAGPREMQSHDQIWKEFAKCKIKMDQELSYAITCTPAVKTMNHKKITVSGFILPLESKNKFSHFLLSKNAPTCAFCPPGGPNEVVEVFSSKSLMWKENLATFSGTLNLVNSGDKGVFFQLKDAVEM
jgi:uncharacterized protein